jgi:RHS repeat-associated protein
MARDGAVNPAGPWRREVEMANTSVVKNALGNTGYFQYDAAGQQVAALDPRGYPTYFAYDLAGRQEAVTDALGYTGYFWHDAAGRQTAQVGADGSPTYFQYDLLGRQVAVTDALGSSAYYQHDLAGQQAAQVDALAYVTYFYYDVLGRQYAVRDAADGLVYYQYDALGRRVALKDQRGYASYFAYDAMSRLVSELDPLGNATYYQYAAEGSLMCRTDGRGQTAYFEYDAVGRLTATLNPADEASYFGYDLRGDMTAALNGRGNPTYFGYDAVSRLASETDGIGDRTYYAYDPAGHLTERLDGEGRWAQWSYDGVGRRVAAAYQDGAYAYFTFDAAGRPIAMRDTWGESQYQYDSVGRLIARRWPDGKCVYYEYDSASNVTALTGPDGGTTYYEYGALGGMKSIHTARGGWAYYDYDPAGHCILRQNPNGTLAYFGYDEVGRISSLRNLKGDMSPICYFDYFYDETGLVTSIARQGGVTIYYGYDAASRLTGETWQGPAGALYAFAYGYDPAGNRAWKEIDGKLTHYTYDAAERLLQEVSDAKYTYYSYDKNGSSTRIEAPDDGKYTYFEYSDARLLRSAHVLPEERWNYFHYDGNLTRYCIEDSLGCQYYYWDGLKLLQRDNLTTGAARTFTHGHAPVPGIANMVEYAEGEDSHDFHYDMRGTVHGITDAEQDVAQTYEHDAWGVKLSEAGDLENPIQYQGCAWLAALDTESLQHSLARQYRPWLGRFLSPEVPPHSSQLCAPGNTRRAWRDGRSYCYADSAPPRRVDPDGCESRPNGSDNTAKWGEQPPTPGVGNKERFVAAMDKYLDRESALYSSVAHCFHWQEFVEKVRDFLRTADWLTIEFTEPGKDRAGLYTCWSKKLTVPETALKGNPLSLLHELMHAYADRHDLFGWCLLTSEIADESFAYAVEELIGQLETFGGWVGRLSGMEGGLMNCATLQSDWEREISPFTVPEMPRFMQMTWPTGHFATRFEYKLQRDVLDWPSGVLRSDYVPSGKISLQYFVILERELGLRFDCECVRTVIEPMLERIAGERCCISCAGIPREFGGNLPIKTW